ncbi:DUF3696 domain-containing protein [Myxococcota bacterium]|nr:DUF3696 domain-containing protein [Myxococcota bacterium]
MFKKIRIQNFKAWDERLGQEGVPLGPITLLLGTNSSGKTSLLQPFQLIKQTVTSADPHLQINFGGDITDLINLGSWSDVIYKHQKDLSLSFGFDLQKDQDVVCLNLEYKLDDAGRVVVQTLSYEWDEKLWGVIRHNDGNYQINAPDLGAGFKRPGFEPIRSISFSSEAYTAINLVDHDVIHTLSLQALRQFEQISYLGPLRAAPRRTEQWNQQRPGQLGADGASTIKALLASANDRRNPHTLIQKISVWLKRMGIADALEVRQLGNSIHYEVRVLKDGLDCNLLDVGFGVSQVLPVLTLAYFAPLNSTVIIEEPEIHLHPLAQTLLADLFVEVSRERGIQFLVETHSEHLFRRLQFLISDEQVKADDCLLYFVEQTQDGQANLRALEVDGYGRIQNWPEHFFGDALGETERQMMRMMTRMMAEVGQRS